MYFAAGIHDENDGLFGKVVMSDGHDPDSKAMSSTDGNLQQPPDIANLFANNSTPAMSTMMPSPMMMPSSNGMPQPADSSTQARIDAVFQMLDSTLISLESGLVARMPQLEGMIQSFNATLTSAESTLAGHPIDDLSDPV